MKFGHPDWGISSARMVHPPLQDLADIAAQLGSVRIWNREGYTLLVDDFEHNINAWRTLSAGGLATATLSTDTAFTKARSARLTTGALAHHSITIDRHLPYPHITPLTLAFVHAALPPGTIFTLTFGLFTPTINLLATLRLTHTYPRARLDVLHHGYRWVMIAQEVHLPTALQHFTSWTLHIDPATGRYGYLELGAFTYDLSSLLLSHKTHAQPPSLYIAFSLAPLLAGPQFIHLDALSVSHLDPFPIISPIPISPITPTPPPPPPPHPTAVWLEFTLIPHPPFLGPPPMTFTQELPIPTATALVIPPPQPHSLTTILPMPTISTPA